jgi:hypothetical protein
MLNLDPTELGREIDEARQYIRNFLTPRKRLIDAMAGRHYRSGVANSEPQVQPENYAFSYKAFIKPQLCFGIPTSRVEVRRSAADRDIAQGLQDLVNSWANETDWKGTLSDVCDDLVMGFAVTKVTVQPRGDYQPQEQPPAMGMPGAMPGMDPMGGMMPGMMGQGAGAGTDVGGDFQQRPNYPAAVRVDPDAFFVDPQARSFRRARFIGHTYERDLEDVKADPRLDPQKVATLASADVLERDAGTQAGASDPTASAMVDRKRITLYELYLPEHKRIMTLARSQGGHAGNEVAGAMLILRDEAYFGPDDGPYDLWGLDTVTGEMIPISPLQALWDGFAEINIHARAAGDAAATHKIIGVALQTQADDAAKINNTPAGSIALVSDPASVKPLELGGASATQLEWLSYLRARFETHLGFTDAQRGLAQANKTATGESIADKNSDIRIDLMRDRVRTCLKSVYSKVAWYFWNDASIGRVEFMNEAGEQLTWVAGPWEGGYVYNRPIPPADYQFDSVELDIDAESMTRQDDPVRQKRAQDFVTLVASVIAPVVGPAMVNWRALLDMYGRAYNQPELSKIVLLDQMGVMIPPDPLSRPPHQPGQPAAAGGLPGQGMLGAPGLPGPGPGMGGIGMNGMMANARGGISPAA